MDLLLPFCILATDCQRAEASVVKHLLYLQGIYFAILLHTSRASIVYFRQWKHGTLWISTVTLRLDAGAGISRLQQIHDSWHNGQVTKFLNRWVVKSESAGYSSPFCHVFSWEKYLNKIHLEVQHAVIIYALLHYQWIPIIYSGVVVKGKKAKVQHVSGMIAHVRFVNDAIKQVYEVSLFFSPHCQCAHDANFHVCTESRNYHPMIEVSLRIL